ncbi:MAG: hypothetical protein Q8K93_04900 [Reyranella sp.]|uniref:hypothetical protein n=1 Tax=Reyranella sp. TaxID=1929291 RepID=UPI00273198BE|nr:hypothetical protein [Reyranella sp.]MDP1961523.1 hypothetical protein [Reyranella sp.]MDP2374897.1 hypothetical protein [Reyranella sp.]
MTPVRAAATILLTDLASDTIYDALNSKKPHFSDRTLFKIEKALGKSFLGQRRRQEDEAPEHLGSYSVSAAKPYIGEYVCVRLDFTNPRNLYVYLMDIAWSDEEGHLTFQEKQRKDAKFTNKGNVYLPPGSPIVNLVTVHQGKVRHIIASQIDGDGVMRGLLQTLHNPFGAAYVPVSTPFVLRKTNGNPNLFGGFFSRSGNQARSHRMRKSAPEATNLKVMPRGRIEVPPAKIIDEMQALPALSKIPTKFDRIRRFLLRKSLSWRKAYPPDPSPPGPAAAGLFLFKRGPECLHTKAAAPVARPCPRSRSTHSSIISAAPAR